MKYKCTKQGGYGYYKQDEIYDPDHKDINFPNISSPRQIALYHPDRWEIIYEKQDLLNDKINDFKHKLLSKKYNFICKPDEYVLMHKILVELCLNFHENQPLCKMEEFTNSIPEGLLLIANYGENHNYAFMNLSIIDRFDNILNFSDIISDIKRIYYEE